MRVVYEDQQLGVMSAREAVDKAKSVGLDLVEVAPNAKPPVCRVCDYGKYKYEQSKLKKKKAKSVTRVKEIKLRVGTDKHDYDIKMARSEQFLEQGKSGQDSKILSEMSQASLKENSMTSFCSTGILSTMEKRSTRPQ